MIGLAGVGVTAFALGIALDAWTLRAVGQVAIPAAAGRYGVTQPRHYRLTSEGIAVSNRVLRQFYPWEAVEGYALSEEALVVSRRGRHRPALRWDLAAIEDVDAVVTALDRHLRSAE